MVTATAAPGAATTSPQPCFPDQEAASSLVGELYEAHGRMVVGLCRFLLRDPVEADDAAQQSFMAVHRSVLGGAVPRDAPAWLAAIARNECRARIKRRMREPLPLLEPDGLEGQLPDPFHAAARSADLRALRDGLEALPETQRNAFVLREFAGLSYEELSVALGVTEPAVESLLVRARSKLRLALVRANPLVVPLVLRDQLARLASGFDDGSAGAVAKLVSLPLAAKLAAAGAGVALVATGGSFSDVPRSGDRLARSPAGVVTAPAAARGAAAGASRGSSSSSPPVMVTGTVHRGGDHSRQGSGTSDDAAAGSSSATGEQDSASSDDSREGGASPPGTETSGGDAGSEDTPSGDTRAPAGAREAHGGTSGSAEDSSSTGSESSLSESSPASESGTSSESDSTEKLSSESGSGENHGSDEGSSSG